MLQDSGSYFKVLFYLASAGTPLAGDGRIHLHWQVEVEVNFSQLVSIDTWGGTFHYCYLRWSASSPLPFHWYLFEGRSISLLLLTRPPLRSWEGVALLPLGCREVLSPLTTPEQKDEGHLITVLWEWMSRLSMWFPLILQQWGPCYHLVGIKFPSPSFAFLIPFGGVFGVPYYSLLRVEV